MPATYDFNPDALIRVWENGYGKSAGERAGDLLMMWKTEFRQHPEALDLLSIESREQFLLEIRRNLFGRKFSSIARCPSCNEMIQWEMQYSDFSSAVNELKEEFPFEADGYRIRYRLPRENDLEKADGIEILKKCVLHMYKDDDQISIDEVPVSFWTALEKEIEIKSPLSSSLINLACPECEHQWSLHFSVLEFLWTEIEQWARRFLHDIGTLALHYGWSELELMRMNPIRRSYYLNLLAD